MPCPRSSIASSFASHPPRIFFAQTGGFKRAPLHKRGGDNQNIMFSRYSSPADQMRKHDWFNISIVGPPLQSKIGLRIVTAEFCGQYLVLFHSCDKLRGLHGGTKKINCCVLLCLLLICRRKGAQSLFVPISMQCSMGWMDT